MIWSPVWRPSCSAALSSWTPAMKMPTSFPPASLRPTLSPFWKRTITVFGLEGESKIWLCIAITKKVTLKNCYLRLYTDPYISWSSMLGFSGTLGGAWCLGATVTAGTAETEKRQTCLCFQIETITFIFTQNKQSNIFIVYPVVFLVEDPPSLLAKAACPLRFCQDLWMVWPWRPFLPACLVGPLWWYHKVKYQNMSYE